MTLLSRTVRIDAKPDLPSILSSLGAFVWAHEREGFIAWGEAARIDPGTGPERFVRAAAMLAELFGEAQIDDEVAKPGSGPLAFASFTFDPETPGSRVVVPAASIMRSGDETWITLTGDPHAVDEAPPSIESGDWESIPEPRWMHAVARVRDQIRGGWLSKVVVAREVAVRTPSAFDVRDIASSLAETFPSCFTFSFDGLVGASPELLVRRTGTAVASLVLAGSARRGVDAAEDDRLGRELLASGKERSEHSLAVGTVRDVLSLACAELEVDEEPSLVRLANVQHLGTQVAGRLLPDVPTALELAGRLHPTAAVCGVPASDALALIRSLEGFDRGRYAGPIGWVDARGDGEFAIALRCAEIDGNIARLFAGNGIVADSDPEAELAETQIKLAAMQSAMGLGRP